MALVHSLAIEVRRVKGKGRGVFARRAIAEGDVIERVPVIVLPAVDIVDVDDWTELAGYCFNWAPGKVALALGYGSLYNHSYRPNARYDDHTPQAKVFTAIRDIAEGEEITINYNGDPEDRSPVGFDVVETSVESKTRKASRKAVVNQG
jgi:SET domain-containing protein